MQRKPSPNAGRTGLNNINNAYPPQSPSRGYSRGRLETMPDKYPPNELNPSARDVICPENENLAAVRLNEVVAKLVDKDLIPCVHYDPSNNFPTVIRPPEEYIEIMTERLRRHINQKILMLTDQTRKCEKEE